MLLAIQALLKSGSTASSQRENPSVTPGRLVQLHVPRISRTIGAMGKQELAVTFNNADHVGPVTAAARPTQPSRIRRQGPPSERHQALARALQRDVWKLGDPDEKARRVEQLYDLPAN